MSSVKAFATTLGEQGSHHLLEAKRVLTLRQKSPGAQSRWGRRLAMVLSGGVLALIHWLQDFFFSIVPLRSIQFARALIV